MLAILTNKALTELNLEMFKDVITTTSEALECEPNNAKALYRRSLAYKAFAEKHNET